MQSFEDDYVDDSEVDAFHRTVQVWYALCDVFLSVCVCAVCQWYEMVSFKCRHLNFNFPCLFLIVSALTILISP